MRGKGRGGRREKGKKRRGEEKGWWGSERTSGAVRK